MLQELRVPAEHRAGKPSQVPSGRFHPSRNTLQVPGAGERRSHLSLLAPERGAGQLQAFPCPARGAEGSLHAPHGAADPKTIQHYGNQNKPRPVLLEQSWSQVLGKAQNSPSREAQRGLLPPLFPANPAGGQHGGLGNHPSLSSSPGISLQSQLQQQQAGLRGRGQGGQLTRMLWSTLDQQCPTPSERSDQGDAIPDFWVDKELGSCMDRHSMGKQHLDPTQLLQRGSGILPAPSQAQEFC